MTAADTTASTTTTLTDATTTLADLKTRVLAFANERDWGQFHTPKNLSMALAAEAGELMEHFLWLDTEASRALMRAATPAGTPAGAAHAAAPAADTAAAAARRQKIEDELADVLVYALEFANVANIDLAAAIESKMRANAQKYPVEKARGNARKYTEL